MICGKISKNIGVIYSIRSFVPKCVLRTLYFGLIHPYYQYCLPIFAATYNNHLEPLILLQKKAIRIISGARYLDHTEPLYAENKILKLRDLYKFNLGCYAYKNPSILANFQRSHTYNTRSRNLLLPPMERLRSSQQSVVSNTIRNWNDIPSTIQQSISIASFKYQYKTYLLSQYNRNVN